MYLCKLYYVFVEKDMVYFIDEIYVFYEYDFNNW